MQADEQIRADTAIRAFDGICDFRSIGQFQKRVVRPCECHVCPRVAEQPSQQQPDVQVHIRFEDSGRPFAVVILSAVTGIENDDQPLEIFL